MPSWPVDGLAGAGIGLALGVVTGMPLGVVNVAIVDAAVAGDVRFATRVGIGGALADAVHASLAFIGIGRVVTERPDLVRALAVVAAVIVIAYAAHAWRARRTDPTTPRSTKPGVLVGIAMTLPNPGALGAWVAVAASVWPDIAMADAIILGVCVGIGSAVWFALLARWIGKRRDRPVMRHIPRIALVMLVALALVGVARAM